MKNWIKLILCSCALVLFISPLLGATTYYVDFAAGSDSNAGTSTGSPWKRAKGDSNATGTAAATSLANGDTIKFKGGIYYTGQIAVATSGVTYDGNSDGTWGTGRAEIDLAYVLDAYAFSASANVGNITIRSFNIRNGGGWADDDSAVLAAAAGTTTNASPRSANAIVFYAGNHTNILIADIYVERMGGWRNTQGWLDNTIAGSAIAIRDCQTITITNVEATKLKVGVAAYGSSWGLRDFTVIGCSFHDYIVWGVDLACQAAGVAMVNLDIQKNRFYNYAQFNKGNWWDAFWPHTDGIFLRSAGIAANWTNVTIRWNQFYEDNPESSEGGTASIYVSQGPPAEIYGNTFRSDSQTRSIGIGHLNPSTVEQVVRIYNNTFYTPAGTAIIMAGETDPARRRVFIENNIFWKNGTANEIMIYHSTGVTPETLDYNIYYSTNSGVGSKYIYASGSTYYQFGSMASLGYEANGRFIDPGFRDVSSATPSVQDLRLNADSAALTGGVDLSAYFTTDILGSNIVTWGVGAYTGTNSSSEPSPEPAFYTYTTQGHKSARGYRNAGTVSVIPSINTTADLWQTFEFTDPTAANLDANDNTSTGTWLTNDNTVLMSISTSGERALRGTINGSSDTGHTRGLRKSHTANDTGNVQFDLVGSATGTISAGTWWKFVGPTPGASKSILLFAYSGGTVAEVLMNTTTKTVGFSGGSNNGVALVTDTWYWITAKIVKNSTSYISVYDTTGTLVGTEVTGTAANQDTRYVSLGRGLNETADNSILVYWDDLVLDWTDATYPLGL